MTTSKPGFVLRSTLNLMAAALVAPLPQVAHAQAWAAPTPSHVEREIADRAGDLKAFYAARAFQPLWIDRSGQPTEAAATLVGYLQTAQFDG
ncbi:MAG: hypothetical protein ABIP41_06870, partial [Croceibacterium sp.]